MEQGDIHELERAAEHLLEVARGLGLHPPPVEFEVVSVDRMYEIAARGLPERFAHWTHGAEYFRQKTLHEHGLLRIYELVINSDPARAYLLETNRLIEQKMVIAHVYGHADFFRRNVFFRETNRHADRSAAAHAEFLRQMEIEHGEREVEVLLDAALALMPHSRPGPRLADERQTAAAPPETPYDDILYLRGRPRPQPPRGQRPVPVRPDPDILAFLIEHSPVLEPWQREVLEIVRTEWLGFWPAVQTHVMDEGYATFWHEKILEHADLSLDEHVEFRRAHTSVVAHEYLGDINPYRVGYAIWKSIERRWDEAGSDVSWHGGRVARPGAGGRGLAKVLEVAADYRDAEFVRTFLTEELVQELDLFTYHFTGDRQLRRGQWVVDPAPWEEVRNALADQLSSAMVPTVLVESADYERKGELLLRHDSASDGGRELDLGTAREVLRLIARLWGRPVHLKVLSSGREITLTEAPPADEGGG
jgi:stage V sporulation protein R